MSEQLYNSYMEFKNNEPNPLAKDVIGNYLESFGASSTDISDLDVELIQNSYNMPHSFRRHHGLNHMTNMGQPDVPEKLAEITDGIFTEEQAKAIIAIAGLFHDISYKHIDAIDSSGNRAWSVELRNLIGDFANYKTTTQDGTTTYTTQLTEHGAQDPTALMVSHIFGMDDGGITNQQGGNEFDSALAAAKWLENKGADAKFIVATASAIAATVPFKTAIDQDEAGEITDGHMGDLAKKLSELNYNLNGQNHQPNWPTINAVMPLAVHMANRDVADFASQDNFSEIIRGGRNIKVEDLAELRQAGETTIRLLARAAGVERSAPFLYQSIAGKNNNVPAANVFHFYIRRDNEGKRMGEDCYPPLEVYKTATDNTEHNTELATIFFKSHEVGIVLVNCVATLMGRPDAPVPGIVDQNHWPKDSVPNNEQLQKLTPDEQKVYEELMHGKNQVTVDIVTTNRSPVSGYIFGTIGRNNVLKISDRIQRARQDAKKHGDPDPFCQHETARDILQATVDAIGPKAFEAIMDYLDNVRRYYRNDPDSQKSNPAFEHQLASVRRDFAVRA